ncbi:Peptide-methionine (S)-S-oxide reductase [Arachnomyces sp. PD_36]|nr:Peptide-methionine (S)-S-oxide reductase [Arachnomyces sp. PD_36]
MARLLRPFTTSTSLSLNPESSNAARNIPDSAQRAVVAAGCFWGVEYHYRKKFGNGRGLLDAKVGYTGGDTESPSYRGVCTGRTGRMLSPTQTPLLMNPMNQIEANLPPFNPDAEALLVIFDPSIVSYRQLIEFFYRMHDPTTANRQGPDVGTPYRSAIFTQNEEQRRIAEDITKRVEAEWWKKPVTTAIEPAGPWWNAEDYHQEYQDRNPGGYECPSQ